MATTLSSKEFSLKWNNFSNNLTFGFLSHLSENNLVDVTLAVEGQLLAAHKLVLSVCSPYFKNIFKENPCQHPVIILKDVKHAEIISLLKFMYQGEVNVKQEDLPTFLKVAQMLQIKGLEGGEKQIIPLLSDYVNIDLQDNSKDVNALSEAPNDLENRINILDMSVQSHRITKRNIETRKKRMVDRAYNDEKDDENESSSKKDKYEVETKVEASDNNNEEIIELSNQIISKSNEHLEENLLQSAVEPVTYRLSSRGRPQLIYRGYVYNLTSHSKVCNNSHYRCAEQHRGCRGKCSVIAERFMPTGVNEHNHPPSYESEHDYRKKKYLDTDNS
ncbi:protein abrupt-like isoform X2 [Pogonomyrmex barbatus]|uniref:Protein abrupt-like isoform X2 n=1 Tax=Pogonomyrmex barbatus TaxID=144034 RepID=A0A6I9WGL5_9HYME|nr:protein abrupt-like isoform X2 [Pogonomyrmex barbatus]